MMKRFLLSLLAVVLLCGTLLAANGKEHVLVFERSTNTNYICYDINLLTDGQLNVDEPLKSYWMLNEGRRTEDLTYLDKKMAFGVKVVSHKENEAVIHLTAYKDLKMRICKYKGKWAALIKVNGRDMVVEKFFAQMMNPPFSIRCRHVDIYGTDLKTGEKCRERIKA